MPYHARADNNRRRLRPYQLRLIRGVPLYDHKRHGAPLVALQAPPHGAPHQGEHRAPRCLPRDLRLPGHVSVLRQPLGGRRGAHLHTVRNPRLHGHHLVAIEAEMAGPVLRRVQRRMRQVVRLRAARWREVLSVSSRGFCV